MNPMNFLPPANQSAPFMPAAAAPPPPVWFPQMPPLSSSFWNTMNVDDRLQELRSTLDLAKAMKKELETLVMMKDGDARCKDGVEDGANEIGTYELSKLLENNGIDLASQELHSLEAANAVMSKLRFELEPFKIIMDDSAPWEEKSAAVKLANKLQKHKRNKLWRKRKKTRVAEVLAKECERFDQADQEVDEWRAREIAKEIARRKVEKMKEIAKLKAKEERMKLESEAIFFQRRMTNFLREYELRLRKRSARQWLLLIHMLLRMQLPLLRNLENSLVLKGQMQNT